ncbi:hypothetical protein C8N25_10759 [Algoriphagus antarcticus]|uniref:Uncharacterized protein n=1 Tax=Algoriphagus antarcticus TaxID=238540 RepID=A0A3E0DY95_9BACT|nr:hypothetical protein C8N25_10759 [Algoriphagus antarcticus]
MTGLRYHFNMKELKMVSTFYAISRLKSSAAMVIPIATVLANRPLRSSVIGLPANR